MPAYVYMLRCGDGSLYTGWTNNLQHRLSLHRAGRGAKYTRGRAPLTLVYAEEQPDRRSAMKRECELKKLARAAKLQLAAAWAKSENAIIL